MSKEPFPIFRRQSSKFKWKAVCGVKPRGESARFAAGEKLQFYREFPRFCRKDLAKMRLTLSNPYAIIKNCVETHPRILTRQGEAFVC